MDYSSIPRRPHKSPAHTVKDQIPVKSTSDGPRAFRSREPHIIHPLPKRSTFTQTKLLQTSAHQRCLLSSARPTTHVIAFGDIRASHAFSWATSTKIADRNRGSALLLANIDCRPLTVT